MPTRYNRSTSSRVLVRGARRESLWVGVTLGVTTMTAPGGTITNASNAALLALRPFTVIRLHMAFWLQSDQAAAIETQHAGFGVAVVSDQAVAIGVTAVPTPITDIGSDLWFAHRLMYADESNLTDRTRSGQFFEIDSKAMRKVEDGQTVIMVAELSSTGSGLQLVSGGRMLIKTH